MFYITIKFYYSHFTNVNRLSNLYQFTEKHNLLLKNKLFTSNKTLKICRVGIIMLLYVSFDNISCLEEGRGPAGM